MAKEILIGIILISFGIFLIIKYPNVWWLGLIIIATGIGTIGRKLNI